MKIRQTICWMAFLLLTVGAMISCSESDDETTTEEFANWEARNNEFFLSLEDSLKSNTALWCKWKTFTKDEKKAGVVTDYVYAKRLEAGVVTEHPLYSDTVRVAYRGWLIPSANYPQGYVFDQTYVGDFSLETCDVSDLVMSGYVDGFSTALQHMYIGDRYRIYIPYTLGYGTTTSSGIPAYSTLIFDVVLIDYSSGSEKMDPWSARRQ